MTDVGTFPSLGSFSDARVGAYELQMGRQMEALLAALTPHCQDKTSNAAVLSLVRNSERWSGGHAYFREVRRRLLSALRDGDRLRERQYYFEEACCQALYNATSPPDPFDPSSAYFVVPFAMVCARDNAQALASLLRVLQ